MLSSFALLCNGTEIAERSELFKSRAKDESTMLQLLRGHGVGAGAQNVRKKFGGSVVVEHHNLPDVLKLGSRPIPIGGTLSKEDGEADI